MLNKVIILMITANAIIFFENACASYYPKIVINFATSMYEPSFFAAQTNDSICSSSLDETST